MRWIYIGMLRVPFEMDFHGAGKRNEIYNDMRLDCEYLWLWGEDSKRCTCEVKFCRQPVTHEDGNIFEREFLL